MNKKTKAASTSKKQTALFYQQKKTKTGWYFNILGLGIVMLLGIIIYSNSFNCTFNFDDTPNIVQNTKILNLDLSSLWHYSSNRFIPYLTFAINYHFGKLDVWGYHLVNLIIHLINSCLVWWLTLLIFSSPNMKSNPISKNKNYLAFFVALLFVSHPLATQSVTYIVQRLASLVALFYLLSVALYMSARLMDKDNKSKYVLFAGSMIVGILALISKENSYTLPFAIMMIEIFFFQTKSIKINFKDYRVILIFVGLICFVVFVLFKVSSGILKPIPPDWGNDFKTITSFNYLLTQFNVIIKYIQLLFVPINQNLDYDFSISNNFFEIKTLLCFVLLLSLLVLAIFLFNKNKIISFGILWFFLALVVESSVIPISDVIFEHRTYLPSFGFFLTLSTLLYGFQQRQNYKNLVFTIFGLIVITNSYFTYNRNKVWENEITIWSDAISKSPSKARPYYNRGVFLDNNKKYPEALQDYNKAIDLQPNYAEAHCNRGNLLTHENRFDEAIKDLNKAIEVFPKYPEAYNNRGNLNAKLNKNKEALYDYNKAIGLNPKCFEAYSNRGQIFEHDNKIDEAINDFNMSIKLNPNYPFAYMNRGCLYNNQKKHQDALADFNKAIELNKDFADAYFNRGIVEMNMGNKDNSCLDYKMASKLGHQKAEEFYNKYCK